jgi:Ca2+/Na+ antiporter
MIYVVILIIVVIALIILFSKLKGFYNDHRFTVRYILLAVIVGWVIHFSNINMVTYSVIALAIYLVFRLSYKKRIEIFVNSYINTVVSDRNRNKELTETSFFNHPRTRKLLRERTSIGKQTSWTYMSNVFQTQVLLQLKYALKRELFPENNNFEDRIYFDYDFYPYTLYLEEQKSTFELYGEPSNLAEYLNSLNLVSGDFAYIEDVAFFSNNLLNTITDNFIPFLKSNSSLVSVPFSEQYLSDSMYKNNFLTNYVSQEDIELLNEQPDLFQEDFEILYSAVANEELNIAVQRNEIKQIPQKDKNEGDIFIVNYENENGIIENEFGQEFEQHRACIDISVSDELDDLDIPA